MASEPCGCWRRRCGTQRAAAVAVSGAPFDNWVSVEVFLRDTGRATYEHAYTLDAETVKGV